MGFAIPHESSSGQLARTQAPTVIQGGSVESSETNRLPCGVQRRTYDKAVLEWRSVLVWSELHYNGFR